jgi:hypothetical protein
VSKEEAVVKLKNSGTRLLEAAEVVDEVDSGLS